jgi:transposase
MADIYNRVFRERAVALYEQGDAGVHPMSERLGIGYRTLQRWVAQLRRTGSLASRPRGGGWTSRIDLALLTRVIEEVPDSTAAELCAAYNGRVVRTERTSVSGIQRALRRLGFVFEKNARGRWKPTGRTSSRSARRSETG